MNNKISRIFAKLTFCAFSAGIASGVGAAEGQQHKPKALSVEKGSVKPRIAEQLWFSRCQNRQHV